MKTLKQYLTLVEEHGAALGLEDPDVEQAKRVFRSYWDSKNLGYAPTTAVAAALYLSGMDDVTREEVAEETGANRSGISNCWRDLYDMMDEGTRP